MDLDVVAGMFFTLVLVAMVGGFFLLLPISRRLGTILEQRLNERSASDAVPEQVRQLRAAVQSLRAEVERLAERQEFTDALLASDRTLHVGRTEESKRLRTPRADSPLS